MIQVTCACGNVVSAPEEATGQRMTCRKCGAALVVQGAQAPPPGALPYFESSAHAPGVPVPIAPPPAAPAEAIRKHPFPLLPVLIAGGVGLVVVIVVIYFVFRSKDGSGPGGGSDSGPVVFQVVSASLVKKVWVPSDKGGRDERPPEQGTYYIVVRVYLPPAAPYADPTETEGGFDFDVRLDNFVLLDDGGANLGPPAGASETARQTYSLGVTNYTLMAKNRTDRLQIDLLFNLSEEQSPASLQFGEASPIKLPQIK